MALVLFTGTIATLSNEVDWLIQHDMRVAPKGEVVSWGEMEAAARSYQPGDTVVSISAMPVSSVPANHFAYRARMIDERGVQYFLHINQWTGEVTGTTHPLTVQRFFRDLHRYLFMPNVIGLPIVSSLAIVLAISLYTGLKTARNWRTLATRIRFNKNLRTAMGDAHKAAGIWASWFFIIIIVTGVWYLAELLGRSAGVRFDPPGHILNEEQVSAFGDIIDDADASVLVAAAKKAFPELKPTAVSFPQAADRPVVVSGRAGNILIRERANSVFLHPVSAEVIAIRRAKEIGWLKYLNQIADPLHFGYFGGLPTKLIWFFFGVAMTGLSLTGVWLTYKRLKPTTLSKAQFATLPVLMGMMIAGYFWFERYQAPDTPTYALTLPAKNHAGIDSSLALALDDMGIPNGKMRLVLASEKGRPNIQNVTVMLSNQSEPFVASARAHNGDLKIPLQIDAHTLSDANWIDVSINLASGRKIMKRWDRDYE